MSCAQDAPRDRARPHIRGSPVPARGGMDARMRRFVPAQRTRGHISSARGRSVFRLQPSGRRAVAVASAWCSRVDRPSPIPTRPAARVRAVTPLSDGPLIADDRRAVRYVRELLARLASTDVIVYVELTGSPEIPPARTKLVGDVSRRPLPADRDPRAGLPIPRPAACSWPTSCSTPSRSPRSRA